MATQTGGEAVVWDGWKDLLSLNPNYKEPEPNTDPNYVPSPPSIASTEISAQGKVQLRFSEDVWTIENLRTAKFPSYTGFSS